MDEVWNITQLLCTAVITMGGAGAIIIGIIKWAHKPTDTRDETLKRHDELFDNDNKRLVELEEWRKESDEAQKVILKSLLAMMSHEIDGNHLDDLKKSRDDLQEYLIRR